MRARVLVVTNELDVGADYVVRELGERGVDVVRLNTERAPDWELSVVPGAAWHIASQTRSLTSDECSGVWWRRPEWPSRAPDVEDSENAAVIRQWRAFLAAFATVSGPTWISDPSAIYSAENKARQLALASEVGFSVPQTLWTNDVSAAESRLNEQQPNVIVKSVATAYWETPVAPHFVFAGAADAKALPSAHKLAAAPLCFQRPVTPKDDIRVTVVGNRCFAAIRDPDVGDPVDWRLGEQTPWRPTEIAGALSEKCAELVRRLGLRFGGIDLARDADGRFWFIEINPNGEWAWLEAAGLPIAAAISDELTMSPVDMP